jgi:hypothetical protein
VAAVSRSSRASIARRSPNAPARRRRAPSPWAGAEHKEERALLRRLTARRVPAHFLGLLQISRVSWPDSGRKSGHPLNEEALEARRSVGPRRRTCPTKVP